MTPDPLQLTLQLQEARAVIRDTVGPECYAALIAPWMARLRQLYATDPSHAILSHAIREAERVHATGPTALWLMAAAVEIISPTP